LYVQHQQANSLFRNDNSHGAGWLHLDLRGTVSNRDGIGARIELTAGGQTQIREVTAGGSNHAQASRRVEFGLCANPAIDLIVIRWPSGTVDSLTSAGGPIAMNQVLTWVEGTGPVATDAPLPAFAEGPALRLYAGAPNPFSAGTAIRFDLPTSGPVRLRIYDVGGRLVRTLVDGVVPAGRGHSFHWDGRADSGGPVGAGVYFTRLEAGSRREAGRIVRIR